MAIRARMPRWTDRPSDRQCRKTQLCSARSGRPAPSAGWLACWAVAGSVLLAASGCAALHRDAGRATSCCENPASCETAFCDSPASPGFMPDPDAFAASADCPTPDCPTLCDEVGPCEDDARGSAVVPVGWRLNAVPRLLALVTPDPVPAIPPGPPTTTGLYPVPTRPVFRPWLATGPAVYIEPLPGPGVAPPLVPSGPLEEELLPAPALPDLDEPAAAPASASISLTIGVREPVPTELHGDPQPERQPASELPPQGASEPWPGDVGVPPGESGQPDPPAWRWRRTRPRGGANAGNPLR